MPFGRKQMLPDGRSQGRLIHASIPLGSGKYRSAVAFGRAEQVFDDEEKIRALRLICERFLPRHMDAFDESVRRSLHRTAVVRITLTAPPTGKRKQYDREGEEMKYGRME